MPNGTEVDKYYYLDRLSKVRAKYNLLGAMTNVRQVQLPPVTNDGEQPWRAATIALGSVYLLPCCSEPPSSGWCAVHPGMLVRWRLLRISFEFDRRFALRRGRGIGEKRH